MIHRPHAALGRQDVLHAGRRLAGRGVARQSLPDGLHQFDASQPVIAHGLEIALVSVVFLDLRLHQLEHADQHEVLLLLAALNDAFALRDQCVSMQGHDLPVLAQRT